ncbi:uracil-DNA glycosylase [Paenibacillus sp. LHD-117]|uniref:uracil-DNA glycosylase n=1 Tax=Paenibacillus sp. LHD-117 TaxID=3071412 RepID=UPI0027E0B27A|nr:uracil-DNA glycosylase [Paenibacillus sp. LHD-117]MDQ6420901.1 uracil-DNA glycosylase [Paenibacillus sp. LHD-117]
MRTWPDNDWGVVLREEFEQPYMNELMRLIDEQYELANVFPPKDDLLNALRYASYEETKVVILGQDPYHGAGQAHGLSFSVRKGVKLPPSLRNIFKELEADLGCKPPEHGCLESWARQGVLLLNTVLSVEEGKPASHQGFGWEKLTDRIIERLSGRETPMVFLLWGKHAETKARMIDGTRHFVLTSAHPSPLSARKGFFGSKPFSQVNAFLERNGQTPITWEI